MNCPSCDASNEADSTFCEQCGARLERSCAQCGASSGAGARFCRSCGASFEETRPATGAPAPVPLDYTPKHLADKILRSKSALEGERKQVTVLFADVKGSLDLAERVDAEEWHAVLDRFFQILAEGVHRFEGTINQYTGDGVMALFGAPIAHEDHAQRACYAALSLRDDLRRYSDELRLARGIDFAVRMGINSGAVVVGKIGDDLRMDYTAQGHTVGLAARMEELAAANAAYVSEDTARLVSHYVSLRDLGEAQVKGASALVKVFELEGMGQVQTRFDVSRARGLSRFVGRDDDMQLLDQALEQARAGNGQVVGVVAEAGTGKSRLCFEFAERCRAAGLQVYQGNAVAHGKNIPFLPILQVFRAYFGINETDGERAAREKIAGRLLLIDESFREFLPLVFEFMGVPDPERPAPAMDADARQRHLFGVQRRVSQSGAEQDAVVTLIEDLHWLDSGSEAWIEQMVESAPGGKTLVLVNFRPEFHADWMQKSWYRQLPLLPLGPAAIRELLVDLLGRDPSLEGLADAIHERTAGNPFFTEEVVQTLIESGHLQGDKGSYRLATAIDRLEVPDTVQSVLAARIDRLADRDKQVLQTASVIGKEFPEPILATVAGLDGPELGDALRSLKQGEFVYEQSLYPVTEYAFKHPLTQEVALGSQLQERRARTHRAVAEAIEAASTERLDERAALLAYHYEQAGEILTAVRWHRRAAEWLIDTDVATAYEHWLKVRDLANSLPATREAMEQSLKACDMILSNAWRVGMPEDEWERIAVEGEALAGRLDDDRGLFGIQLGLGPVRYLCSSVLSAAEPAERARALAEDLDRESQVLALNVLIDVHWQSGNLGEAVRLSERALEVAGGDLAFGQERYGISIPSWTAGRLGAILVRTGQPGRGVPLLERCMRLSRERDEHEPLAWCLGMFVELEHTTGTAQQALTRAQQCMELAERAGSPMTQLLVELWLGMAHLLNGDADASLSCLEQATRGMRERGVARHELPRGLGLLAEARMQRGDGRGAREAVDEAVHDAAQGGYRMQEVLAQHSRAQVLRALGGAVARSELETTLSRAEALIEQTGMRAYEPFFREERARLAAANGDSAGAQRLLHEACELFRQVEATGHVERLRRRIGG